MTNNPITTAAIIAAAVSLVGSSLTLISALLVARSQVKTKINELTQAQFKDVLSKRIEVYPFLWQILLTYISDWNRFEKKIDAEWANTFFEHLTSWNAQYGVFLSQRAYEKFAQLRERAQDIVKRCREGETATDRDLLALDKICSGDATLSKNDPCRYGLATWLKNDLGSYKIPAVAVTPQ